MNTVLPARRSDQDADTEASGCNLHVTLCSTVPFFGMMVLGIFLSAVFVFLPAVTHAEENPKRYTGDERCKPPPENDERYSAPYNALDHPNDYPEFSGADKHGWSCSYQREDGVIVQFGDSRTPREQWQIVWGNSDGQ